LRPSPKDLPKVESCVTEFRVSNVQVYQSIECKGACGTQYRHESSRYSSLSFVLEKEQ
jgi:hypothetical protein